MLCCMASSTRNQVSGTLGAAIKKAREDAGMSGRKLAEALGIRDTGLVSRWESGDRTPKPDEVEQIAEVLNLDGDDRDRLIGIALGTGEPRWLAVTVPERRQQLAALLNAESTATTVIHVAPLLIPGVLQTRKVIRQIMVDAEIPPGEIDERIIVRIGRRDLYTRDDPAQLHILLGEGAVRTVIGGRAVWAEQLRYLLEQANLENVEIRIVPYSAGWHPGLVGDSILIDSDIAPSIVNVELEASGLILHDPDDVENYRRAAEKVEKKAMSPDSTKELIATVLSELEMHDDETAHP
jgi:transcriptional regulator with XRE-family HTH domain